MALYRKHANYQKHQLYRGTLNQTIACTGFDSLVFGGHEIDHRVNIVTPAGLLVDAYGVAMVAGGIRLVYVGGFDAFAFGSGATVTLGTRQLYPQWWVDTFYGFGQVGYTRELAPSGFDSSLIGAPAVLDNRIRPLPTGWDSLAFGAFHGIDYAVRQLRAYTIEPGDFDHWTPPRIHNVRQIIAPVYVFGQWEEGGFGSYIAMNVRNVNRVVDLNLVHNGIPPFFRGVSQNATIANNARLLAPPGQDSLTFGSDSFIAEAIRNVTPDGWDAFEFGRFAVVYNAAALVQPFGFNASSYGLPAVVNTRRYYDHIGIGQTDVFGLPFIAPRIRTLDQTGSYLNPVGGLIGLPRVSFALQPITPTLPPFGYGPFFGPIIVTGYPPPHISPAGIAPINGVSTGARVANKTPQLYPHWSDDQFTQWGANAIHNQHETYDFQGWVSSLFGATSVDFRTKHVLVPGLLASRMNLLHSVRNVNPDPPGVQYIIPPSMGVLTGFGAHFLRANSIYPDGFVSSRHGVGTIGNNGIRPVGIPIYFDEDTGTQLGNPSLNATHTLRPSTIGHTELWGTPDFLPRTIWAPAGAPDQAVRNHPPGTQQIMDQSLLDEFDAAQMPIFGPTRVELKNRTILHFNNGPEDSYGTPVATIRPIYATVAGLKATKFGFPRLNGGGGIQHYNLGEETRYGVPSLTAVEPFVRYLHPTGLSTSLMGNDDVQNFNRSLPPAGIDALAFGPIIVQRPPPPAEPAGLDATIFGAGTFIDYRIRHVYPEGDELGLWDYELGHFTERLRVMGRHGINGIYTSIDQLLGDQFHAGTPSLDHGLREIAPPPFFPPGGWFPAPQVKQVNRVNVPDNGTFDVFGETWSLAVTPGEIQPRGDDYMQVPEPGLNQQIYPLGWWDNAITAGPLFLQQQYDAMGQARDVHTGGLIPTMSVSNLLGLSGFDAAQFGLATLIGTGCGAQVRAIVGFDALAIGSPAVSG